MRRRRFLTCVAAAGVAGCLGDSRPELRIRSGAGRLHAATDEYLANGLGPGGEQTTYAAALPDRAPDAVGTDAAASLATRLGGSDGDLFHVVTQLRSPPAEPLRFGTDQAVAWDDSAVRLTTTAEPADPTGRLATADELLYTAVWSVEPSVEELPEAELAVET